jgi:hypothetical protein
MFGRPIWGVLCFALFASAAGSASAESAPESGAPTHEELTRVCRYVESIEPRDVRDHTVRSGVFDVDGDGIAETVTGTTEGTMHAETAEIRDAEGNTLELSPTFNWPDYWTLGERWLLYDGRAFHLNFEEEGAQFLSFLSYVDSQHRENIACTISTDVREAYFARGAEAIPVCDAVEAGRLDPLPIEEIKPRRLSDGAYMTEVFGTIRIDFDNDGTPDNLVAIRLSSSAGRGCETAYFDLAESLDGTSDKEERSLLMRLQEAVPDDTIPARPCGVLRRWLTRSGQTYFEVRYRDEAPRSDSTAVHFVTSVVDGEPKRICDTAFRMRWRLTEVMPPPE